MAVDLNIEQSETTWCTHISVVTLESTVTVSVHLHVIGSYSNNMLSAATELCSFKDYMHTACH